MSIEWTADLATGFDEIDNQHKELFKRINSLFEACRMGKGAAEIGNVVKFLEDYVITHFSTEEKYMVNYQYPEYSSHKSQHREFISNFSDLKRQFQEEGAGVHVVVQMNSIIVDWLRNHIRRTDTELGKFLVSRR